jgi:hypothetical protein
VEINPNKIETISNDEMIEAWKRYGKLESCSSLQTDARPVKTFESHSLLAIAAHSAFYDHYPLKLNPNIIWITIVQGFSRYVNLNGERLRSKFVSFEGKKELKVERLEFRKGNFDNDWRSVFPDFANQIEKYIGSSTKDLLECNFSNSSDIDRVVSHISLMDVCNNYFYSSVRGGCGIPYIELMGTINDWKLVKEKTIALQNFSVAEDNHLNVWLKELIPALDHFISAAEGHPDLYFWGSVCNIGGNTNVRGILMTGWITLFYPYLEHLTDENKKKVMVCTKYPLERVEGCSFPNSYLSLWRKTYEYGKLKGLDAALKEVVEKEERVKKSGSIDKNENEEGRVGVEISLIPSGMSKAKVLFLFIYLFIYLFNLYI